MGGPGGVESLGAEGLLGYGVAVVGNSIRLIDLGQACKTGTVKERVQGTPSFIAPEQARCKPLSEQTDVYNFGASLYWALTGRRVPTLMTVEKEDRGIVKEQRRPSAVRNRLDLPVFFLQCLLHLKVGLSFAFHPLLLVVPDHAGVHRL